MSNYTSSCKRIDFITIFFLSLTIIFCFFKGTFILKPFKNFKIAFADNEELEKELGQNIDDILSDIDLSELDSESFNVPNVNLSFKDFVKSVLDGSYDLNYNSLFSYIKQLFLENFRTNLRFYISLFIIVILFELFKSFASQKFGDVKSSIKFIFSFLLATTILVFIKNSFTEIKEVVEGLFSFSSIIFPILIGLLSLSGANKSASVFSSFSVFLLETGSFLINYVLLPLALSILLLSLFGSVFSKGKFAKLIGLFKQIFKYVIIIFFAVFGLLSTASSIFSSTHDGINLKLTKFALKNYIPVLGGYVSDGFDFLFSCSVLIKNAIGLCSIVIIIFKILLPVLFIAGVSLAFKLLSVVTGLIGDGSFCDMFDDVSKSFGNFLTIILGSFLIVFIFVFLIILSVGVVWCDWVGYFYNFYKHNFWNNSAAVSYFKTCWFC